MATNPIERLQARSFGPFGDLDLNFSPKLNVITGDNGTGKTQLLKLMYSLSKTLEPARIDTPSKTSLAAPLANKLIGVFKPDTIGRLASRVRGRSRASISLKYAGIRDPLKVEFSSASDTRVAVNSVPNRTLDDTAVFLPSRELLSIYPGLVSLYESREVSFDETWRDTALLLGMTPLLGPRGDRANDMLAPLLRILEGTVSEENGKFYVRLKTATGGTGKIEAPLVSEGYRKLAMLVRLVQSGALLDGGYLFWDEPEANLNPRTQRAVAKTIHLLAKHGTQVFVATHSVFILRELRLLIDDDPIETQYVGLERTEPSVESKALTGVRGVTASNQNDLPALIALEEEAAQALRYLNRDFDDSE
ncbi:AAA family ATPase [Corynebacterium sp. MSK008]|uniref:AAA family ATPase n=1 Tax=Corynebacterium sp. MSK008 TaxID=3050188 RepID=UPI00254BEFC4|nr:AAA family ATPase [Corynebacterium sp. MSK008]MDK8880482.1 AAA family ATPase [Corynebacterium sp. MSK008]